MSFAPRIPLARLLAIGLPLATLALARPAFAQTAGPTLFTRQTRHDAFALDSLSTALDLRVRSESDDSRPRDGRPRSRFNETRVEETLEIESTGHIIHPNLVDLSISGAFGLSQTSISQTGQPSDSELGFLADYDATAVILRREMAPVTLFSRRHQQFVDRQFGGSVELITESHGAGIDIRSKELPTQVQYTRTAEEQIDRQNDIRLNLDQDSFTWHSEARPTTNQIINWSYAYNAIQQRQTGANDFSNSYQSHDGALTHSADFGERDASNLYSSVTFFSQTGAFALDRVSWDESLRLQHDKKLESHYRYNFDYQSYLGTEQFTHRGDLGVRHILFESLTTSADAGASNLSRSDDEEIQREFGRVALDYRKRVPYGTLSIHAGVNADAQDTTQGTSSQLVVNEPHQFLDPFPVIFTQRGIEPDSFVLFKGIVPLNRNIDYRVDEFPDRVEIVRLPGGQINDGDTILFNYRVSSLPTNSTVTLGRSFGIRYELDKGPLKGLAGYSRYFEQDQDIETNVQSAFIPEHIRDLILGADYRFWRITLAAERQMHESQIGPYDATRYSARYADRIARDITFSLNGYHDTIDYRDTDNQIVLTRITAQGTQRFNKQLAGSITIGWRYEDDRDRGVTEGWEQQAELRWKHRQVDVFLNFRNAFLFTPSDERTTQRVEVGVRRQF